jgi:nucleotide-binding universal stress UspA family protein
MNYRSLLVMLDNGSGCADRMQLATHLARDLDCHLVGLAATGLIDVPSGGRSSAPLGQYAALAWDALRDQAESATERFREQCHRAGVASFEAVIDEADKAESLIRHAHFNDLVIVTQARTAASDGRRQQDLVESVILGCARPTLVLPHAGRFESVGAKVLVACDDSREAARALIDALPLLRRASRVEAVCWREKDSPGDTVVHARLDATHHWLRRHGVTSHVYVETAKGRLADAMLARAGQFGADLIVMGAYGHSRWTERILGGATRGMLAAMTVPVLMSH